MQQAWMRHCYAMQFAVFLGGTLAPVLLMLSPFAVMAATDCTDGKPASLAVTDDKTPCTPPRWRLM